MPAAWELNDGKAKLLIGILHTNIVSMAWALGFRNLQVNVPSMFTMSRGTPWDMGRNEVVKSALANDVDWLFFLDSDVIPPPDIIPRLMAHNLPIVSAVYGTRSPPLEYAVWEEVPNGKRSIPFTPGQGLIEAQFIGSGALLIHTSVFKNLEAKGLIPFFKWTLSFIDPKDFSKGSSEDFYFCRNARSIGYRIMVDTNIMCRHEIDNAYMMNNQIQISEI